MSANTPKSQEKSIVVQLLVGSYLDAPTTILKRDAARDDPVGEAARIVLSERKEMRREGLRQLTDISHDAPGGYR